MADNWFKVYTNMFHNNRKITRLENQKNGDSLVLLWIKLISLARDINDCGAIYVVPGVPYTRKELADQLQRPLKLVETALDLFLEMNMVYCDEDGVLHITNWEEHQNEEGLARIREQTNARVTKHRENKKRKAEEALHSNADVTHGNADVTQQEERIRNKSKIKNNPPYQEDRKERKKKESSGDGLPSCPPDMSDEEYYRVQLTETPPFEGIYLSCAQIDSLRERFTPEVLEQAGAAMKRIVSLTANRVPEREFAMLEHRAFQLRAAHQANGA